MGLVYSKEIVENEIQPTMKTCRDRHLVMEQIRGVNTSIIKRGSKKKKKRKRKKRHKSMNSINDGNATISSASPSNPYRVNIRRSVLNQVKSGYNNTCKSTESSDTTETN